MSIAWRPTGPALAVAAVVYRRHADDIEQRSGGDLLLQVDASGRKGRDGVNGAPGAYGSSAGASGSRGGDAGPAVRGQDGGRVQVRLEARDDNRLVVVGERILPDGTRGRVDEEVRFGDHGSIWLTAQGGAGGLGGHGGRGGDGATGRRGSDATRYSSGGDGGPGGDGGDGGNASSGADGGGGGHVRVAVADADTHLLMLVEHVIAGGRGGRAGANGHGGSGGSGGAGGSSYSWTETEHYTDAEGNSQTRTTSHSNPGGSCGPSGMPGRAGTARVRDGRAGDDGTFVIEVTGGAESRSYTRRYDLRLLAFNHASANDDGIYEPGERVRVYDLLVQNVGGMPTPSATDVELSLVQQGWVLPDDARLSLPRGLAAGDRHLFSGSELWFTIGDYRPPGPDAPLGHPETIHHQAIVPAVRRSFAGYERDVPDDQGRFVIRFPVEADAITGLRSMTPGEAGRLRFAITNVSNQALGGDTDGGRRVRVELAAHDSELGDEHACLLASGDARVPLGRGFGAEIGRIGPGETHAFELTFGFLRNAPHYRSARLWLSLRLGELGAPRELRTVQYRELVVRVAQRYRHQPDADLLLVVNHRTQRDELDAWKRLAKRFGYELAVWDLTLEGGISLTGRHAGPPLIEAFAGKTIIVLNNDVELERGSTRASTFVDKHELRQAALADISVAFVGRKAGLERLLIPSESVEASEDGATGSHELLGELMRVPRASIEGIARRVDVYGWAFGYPDYEAITARAAEKLSRQLAERFPDQRFAIVRNTEETPKQVGDLLLFQRYRMGTLEVRGMLPAACGRLLNAEIDEETLHRPDYIDSRACHLAVLMTESFASKLDRLDELLLDDEPDVAVVAAVVTAMLVDLANELAAVLQHRWRAGLDMAAALPHLSRLGQRVWASAGRIEPDSDVGGELVRLFVTCEAYANAQWRWWEILPPLFWLRRPPQLWRHARRLCRAGMEALFGGEQRDAESADVVRQGLAAAIKTAFRDLERICRDEVGTLDSWGARKLFFDDYLKAPLLAEGITTDAELLLDPADRLYLHPWFRDLQQRDARRSKRRAALMRAAVASGSSLARSESTEALLG